MSTTDATSPGYVSYLRRMGLKLVATPNYVYSLVTSPFKGSDAPSTLSFETSFDNSQGLHSSMLMPEEVTPTVPISAKPSAIARPTASSAVAPTSEVTGGVLPGLSSFNPVTPGTGGAPQRSLGVETSENRPIPPSVGFVPSAASVSQFDVVSDVLSSVPGMDALDGVSVAPTPPAPAVSAPSARATQSTHFATGGIFDARPQVPSFPTNKRAFLEAADRAAGHYQLVTDAINRGNSELLRVLYTHDTLSDDAHRLICAHLDLPDLRGVPLCMPCQPGGGDDSSSTPSRVSSSVSIPSDSPDEEEEEEEEESQNPNFLFDVNPASVAAAQAAAQPSAQSRSKFHVVIRKEDRIPPGEKEHAEQVLLLTKGPKLQDRLGVADYAVFGAGASGDHKVETEVMTQLESDDEKRNAMLIHLERYDMNQTKVNIPLGHIHRLSSTHVPPAEYFNTTDAPIDLMSRWAELTIDDARHIQRYVNTSPFITADEKESSRLMSLYLMNCMTVALHDAVVENMDKHFTFDEQGGITVLYCMLKTAYSLQSRNVDVLRAELEKFGTEGLMNIPGHSVVVAELRIRLLVNQLVVLNGLDTKHIRLVLEGLMNCPVESFKTLFTEERMKYLRSEMAFDVDTAVTLSTADQRGIARTILNHMTSAKVMFLRLSKHGEWSESAAGTPFSYSATSVAAGGTRPFEIECHNCGLNHHLKDCKTPHNQSKIQASIKKFNEEKKKRRDAAGGSSDRDGGSADTIPSRDKSGTAPQFRMNASTGLIELKCLKCKRLKGAKQWTNHASADHAKAIKDPNFCYWKAHPKCPVGAYARQCAAKVEKDSDKPAASAAASKDAKNQKALWDKLNTHGANSVEGKAALNALRAAAAQDFQ